MNSLIDIFSINEHLHSKDILKLSLKIIEQGILHFGQ